MIKEPGIAVFLPQEMHATCAVKLYSCIISRRGGRNGHPWENNIAHAAKYPVVYIRGAAWSIYPHNMEIVVLVTLDIREIGWPRIKGQAPVIAPARRIRGDCKDSERQDKEETKTSHCSSSLVGIVISEVKSLLTAILRNSPPDALIHSDSISLCSRGLVNSL